MSVTTTATSYTLPSKTSASDFAAWRPSPIRRRNDEAKLEGLTRIDLPQWSADTVAAWLHSLGLGEYDAHFRANDITGEVLAHCNHNMLRQLDVLSVGHRLAMLKSLYTIKMQQGIEILAGDYVPESVNIPLQSAGSAQSDIDETVLRLERVVKQQAQTISTLTTDLNNLTIEFSRLKDELGPVWPMVDEYGAHMAKKSKKIMMKRTPKDTSANSSKSEKDRSTGALRLSPTSTSSRGRGLPGSSEGRSSANSSSSSLPQQVPITAMRVYIESDSPADTSTSYKTIPVTPTCTAGRLIPDILRKFKVSEQDASLFALYTRHKGLDSILTPDERPYSVLMERSYHGDEELPIFVLKSDRVVYSGEPFL